MPDWVQTGYGISASFSEDMPFELIHPLRANAAERADIKRILDKKGEQC